MSSSVRKPSAMVGSAGGHFHWLVAASCIPYGVGLLAPHMSTGPAGRLATLIATFTLAAHVPATAAFYADRGLWPFMGRNRARFIYAPTAAAVLGVLIARLATETVFSVSLTLFIGWQLHHFNQQNLGMVSFVLRSRSRPPLSQIERRIIDLSGIAGILGFAPLYAGAPGIGGGKANVVWGMGLVALILAAALLVRVRPTDGLRTAALAGVVAFYVPLYLYRGDIVAATIGYSMTHGAQYLLMAGHLAVGRPRHVALRWIALLGVLVVLGGAALEGVADEAGTSLRWLYGLGLGITAAHFIVDAGLWRLRDPEQRIWMRERFTFLATRPLGDVTSSDH